MATDLLTPVYEGGIRSIHFFNGRVLTAEDLEQEGRAGRRRLRELGKAVGEGVVDGFDVVLPSAPEPHSTVVVSPGRVLNRRGRVLVLSSPVTIVIAPEDEIEPAEDGRFAECTPTTDVPTGVGVYVLAVAPATVMRERAPKVGLRDKGVATRCDHRYEVDGVQFKLIEIDLENDSLVPESFRSEIRGLAVDSTMTPARQSLFRNMVAHLCLGTVEKSAMASDPLGTIEGGEVTYGPLDRLRPAGATESATTRLTECDVPLALIFWTTDRIRFLDMWAARRRVHRPDAGLAAADRRIAEAEAALMQFQRQMGELVNDGEVDLGDSRVSELFRFLPASGMLPITNYGTAAGFDPVIMFSDSTTAEPVFMEGARLSYLLRQSLAFPPIDLSSEEMFWLYWIRENMQAAEKAGAPSPALCFANGHIPFLGEARFDLSRWEYSNYV